MLDANILPKASDRQHLSILTLPLNLIAHLLSFLDDPADLARVCRTCRIFNYMSLPQLYRNPVLTSYDRIRYRDDRPEGWGSASPFSMGLSALVTRSHALLVESLTLRGEWREPELEEYSRVGRVPDSAMMLNLSVRAAIDRTKELRSFSWELDTKMLEIVYLGLNQLPKLTSLSLRFPSSRHPRPTFVIPAFPHLRCLKITDIDPLCYPDDISTILAESRNLRELKLHWSPRMREAQEPSVIIHDYFRKAIAAKTPLKLKRVGIANFYARQTDDFRAGSDPSSMEEITVFNYPGFEDGNPPFSFLDKSWVANPTAPPGGFNPKMYRIDCLTKANIEYMLSYKGMERVYFVTPGGGRLVDHRQPSSTLPRPSASSNGRPSPKGEYTNGTRFHTASVPASPSPINTPSAPLIMLRDNYFSTFISCHGPTLRQMLLPAKWPLTFNQINCVVEHCPNLKQLALATEISAQETFGLLLPALRKLVAIRLLYPYSAVGTTSFLPDGFRKCDRSLAASPCDGENMPKVSAGTADPEGNIAVEEEALSRIMGDRSKYAGLKVAGLGWKGWDLGEFYTVPALPHANGNVIQAPERPDAGSDLSFTSNRPVLPGRNPPVPRAASTTISSARPTVSFSKPSSTHATKSSLGKRARELSSAPFPSANLTSLSHNVTADEPDSPSSAQPSDHSDSSPIVYPEAITKTLRSGEVMMWKRRVRQLPWKILQQWEIWGLDSQEL